MEDGKLLGSLTTFYMPKANPDDVHDVVRLRCNMGRCEYDVDLPLDIENPGLTTSIRPALMKNTGPDAYEEACEIFHGAGVSKH